jgi:hypothetical protein
MKKMSRWLNPTRRRNGIQAKVILITSVASAAATTTRGLPPLVGLCAEVDGQ